MAWRGAAGNKPFASSVWGYVLTPGNDHSSSSSVKGQSGPRDEKDTRTRLASPPRRIHIQIDARKLEEKAQQSSSELSKNCAEFDSLTAQFRGYACQENAPVAPRCTRLEAPPPGGSTEQSSVATQQKKRDRSSCCLSPCCIALPPTSGSDDTARWIGDLTEIFKALSVQSL